MDDHVPNLKILVGVGKLEFALSREFSECRL